MKVQFVTCGVPATHHRQRVGRNDRCRCEMNTSFSLIESTLILSASVMTPDLRLQGNGVSRSTSPTALSGNLSMGQAFCPPTPTDPALCKIRALAPPSVSSPETRQSPQNSDMPLDFSQAPPHLGAVSLRMFTSEKLNPKIGYSCPLDMAVLGEC